MQDFDGPVAAAAADETARLDLDARLDAGRIQELRGVGGRAAAELEAPCDRGRDPSLPEIAMLDAEIIALIGNSTA